MAPSSCRTIASCALKGQVCNFLRWLLYHPYRVSPSSCRKIASCGFKGQVCNFCVGYIPLIWPPHPAARLHLVPLKGKFATSCVGFYITLTGFPPHPAARLHLVALKGKFATSVLAISP